MSQPAYANQSRRAVQLHLDPGPPLLQLHGGQVDLDHVHDTAKSGLQSGGAIPYQEKMERRFNTSFADVQCHADSASAQACAALGAQAYAMGNHIAFKTASPSEALVAHELTHVVQQRRGVDLKGGVGAPGDTYEQQAEAVEAAVQSDQPIDGILGASAAGSAQGRDLQPKLPDGEVTFQGGQLRYVDSALQAKADAVQFDPPGGTAPAGGTTAPPAPGTTASTPIVYQDFKSRSWEWRMEDEDTFSANDVAARFQVFARFGKVALQSGSAWVLDEVTANRQTVLGLSAEVNSLTSRYYMIGGQLEFTLRIQLRFKTADVKETSSTTAGASLSADEKSTLGASLPVGGGEASAGHESSRGGSLNLSKTWGSERVLSGSTFDVTRDFRYTNIGPMLIGQRDNAFDPDVSMIDDVPGASDTFNGSDFSASNNDFSFLMPMA